MESNRLSTVLQENAVLRSELEVMRLRCKNLMEENRRLRQASVTIVSDHSDWTEASLWHWQPRNFRKTLDKTPGLPLIKATN